MFNKKSVILTLAALIASASINTVTFASEKAGWVSQNNKWYYYENNGDMVTGWKNIDNKWYFLESNGQMATGWKRVDNKWYFLEGNGQMVTGWKKIDSKWYFLEGNGQMATGWKKIDNKWYFLENNGQMATGWKKIDSKWYFLENNGQMATDWKKIDNKWYYLKSNGEMATGSLTISGKLYKFNTDGSWIEKTSKALTVEATAYTGYSTTSTGQKPVWGTIAVDPKVIPYGTKVYIPYFDEVFVANNTGGAIKGNKIDIFMNTSKECKSWGRKTIEIEVLN